MNTHTARLDPSAPEVAASLTAQNPWFARTRAAIALSLVFSMVIQPAEAAQTQISSTPLASATSTQVKPNIMYLMDTSGSMASLDMPDEMGSYTSRIGYKTPLCNTIYYNPNITYVVPKKPDGTNFANASFTAAYSDGFQNYPSAPSSGLVNLSTSYKAHGSDTSQSAYYYTYTGAQTITPLVVATVSPVSYTVSNPCRDSDPNSTSTYNTNIATTGGGNWQKKQVTSTSGPGSTDERVNFANWYQYYRTRIQMMKSTASRAFNQLTDSYRVGFVTIAPGNPVSSTQYLPIADFTTGQRSLWFEKLFQQGTHDSTPLREALSRVGRHYAGKTDGINDGMTGDPVQYSCQQNFTLLTTDGYWNGNAGDDLNGSSLGSTSTDSDITVAPRPMWDGGAAVTTTTNKSNTFRSQSCSSSLTRTVQQQIRTIQYQTRTRTTKARTQQIQQRTQQWQTRTAQYQTSTDQLKYQTVQVEQRSQQKRKTTTTTTRALSILIISAPDTTRTTTISAITIGGSNRLPATSSVASGFTVAQTVNTHASNIAGQTLTGGYAVFDSGACTGTDLGQGAVTISGCASNRSYVRIMNPSGSPTGNPSRSTTNSRITTSLSSFSGGSVVGPTTTNSACSAGTTNPAANVSVVTTCPAETDSGFQNYAGTLAACNAEAAASTPPNDYDSTTGLKKSCQTNTSAVNNAPTTTCPAAANAGQTVTCTHVTTGPSNSSACTTTTVAGLITTCTTTSDTGFVNSGTCTASNPPSGPTVTCQSVSDTGMVNFAATSCTPSDPSTGPTVTCNTTDTGLIFADTCTATTPVGGFNASGTQITCATTDTGFVNSGTCTASTSTGNIVTCNIASDSGASNVASCTASDPAGGPTVTCPTLPSSYTQYAPTKARPTCTASGPNASGVSVECLTSASYSKLQYQTTTSTTTLNLSTNVSSTSAPTTGSWTDSDGVCTNPAPSVPSARAWMTGDPPTPTGACTAYPCTVTGTSGGTTGTLADVAQYYYQTDLRPSMSNNVPSGGSGVEDDKAIWQHMTTFTMGLGLSGTLTYRTDYKTANTGDYQQIRDGSLNWPVPSANDPTALDDLWHAAVNGRGLYFSAASPDAVVDGLTTALAGIQARVSSAAAAATSNLEPVAGDNFAYTAKYKTLEWTGELEAHEIDLSTGDVKATVIWSAQSALDTKTGNYCDNRNIYLFRSGVTNNRVNFTWNTQACDSSYNPTGTADTGLNATEQGYFGTSAVTALSQYPTMTDGTGTPVTANQRLLAEGSKMVNFVRGQRGYENFTSNDPGKLYRQRTHVLGDIVNAQPVYVKAPFASYTDDGYLSAVTGVNGGTAFKTSGTASTRLPMVYVAANDGMLHAFYGGTSTTDPLGGTERWSFIPSIVLPNLYKLTDDNYANTHRYSVDGTPTVGDFYDTNSTTWKTMLVAGLNAGGKGFYALDITDPATPKGLWEFKWSDNCYAAGDSSTHYSDCHIGYTFSNPIITKTTDGTWVVLVTSGYNNVNSPAKTGDGQGYLYVLRAYDGKILYKISTGVGNATTPSGLNHIVNWVDSTLVNNTTLRVYGGDLLGNMWRFDINDTINPAGREATLIGQAKSPGSSGAGQPITTRPELALKGSDAFIMFATGRLVGSDDLADTQVQSIYGVVDPLTNTTTAYTDLRGSLKPMAMTTVGTGSTAYRTIACSGTTSACNVSTGWVIDLPDSGERVNVDPKLQLGTLVVASNVPETSACTIGGYSWINFVNFTTGAAVANSTGGSVSQKLSDSLAVGLNIVRLPDGKTVVITTTSDAKQTTVAAPFDTPSPTGKRISWREISTQQ